MMEELIFFNKTGKLALGSRLRMLADRVTDEVSRVYKLYGIDLKAKWFPVFFVLSDGRAATITSIAKEIGHSHPSVSNIIKEMSQAGIVEERKDLSDGRRNVIVLSPKGKDIAEKMPDQYADVLAAIETISGQTRHDLWKAIEEWEFLLSEKSLFRRVEEEKKARESKYVKIIPYESRYHMIFKTLNEDWISAHFEIEEADRQLLDHPEASILQKGGHIFVALYKEEPAGVCALIKMADDEYDFELAKMAVTPNMQGNNIGFLLGQAAVEKAAELGATKLYLESNTILRPAIRLYQKLGFKKVAGRSTPYKRCNIQMELVVTNK